MKKTFPVNINGKIYYIDEDAYTLLQSYLSQLRATFPGEEGKEIIVDIESRISELFDERMLNGASVIVLQNVNDVIEIMGRPEELGDNVSTDSQTSSDTQTPPSQGFAQTVPPPFPVSKNLYRYERHNVFVGVLAGLGQYMNWDVTVLRILTVVLALVTYFWPCVLIYMVAWLVIPPARTPREILEMQGQPVNLETVGQTVIDGARPPVAPVPDGGDFARFINNVFLIIGKCLVAFCAFIGGLAAFATVLVALAIIAGMVCLFAAGSPGLLHAFDISLSNPYFEGWGMTLLMFAVALPMLAILWAGCTVVFKAPPMSKSVIIAGLVIEMILIVATCVLMNFDSGGLLSAVLPASAVAPVTMC